MKVTVMKVMSMKVMSMKVMSMKVMIMKQGTCAASKRAKALRTSRGMAPHAWNSDDKLNGS
jgi:hypothetical protein